MAIPSSSNNSIVAELCVQARAWWTAHWIHEIAARKKRGSLSCPAIACQSDYLFPRKGICYGERTRMTQHDSGFHPVPQTFCRFVPFDPFFKLVNLPFSIPQLFFSVKACRHDGSSIVAVVDNASKYLVLYRRLACAHWHVCSSPLQARYIQCVLFFIISASKHTRAL